jgi:hypothetical protein
MKTGLIPQRFAVRVAHLVIGIFCAVVLSNPCWAAFGDDTEKPRPEFTRQDDQIVAKLIPRGKSTSVLIQFQAAGGTLLGVEGMGFDEAGHTGMDAKDFRSALFTMKLGGLSPGGEVKVAVSSSFFTQATELWALSRTLSNPWVNADAGHIERPGRVQELVLTVKDGGPLDSDGAANGEILLVVGSKDSFWGYALGTLLIRFFGVFLVLGVLMVGMILAGRVFQRLDRPAGPPNAAPAPPPVAERPNEILEVIEPETATAIGVALHLHLSPLRTAGVVNLERSDGSSWARQGRSQIMRDRLLVHDRSGRK